MDELFLLPNNEIAQTLFFYGAPNTDTGIRAISIINEILPASSGPGPFRKDGSVPPLPVS
jgi:hypothetical protein